MFSNLKQIIMKNVFKVLLVALLLPFTLFAQQNSNFEKEFTDEFIRRNIDPRQYVEIYMIDKLNEKIPIWKYNKDQTKPNQLRKILDASSNIQIEFDKSGIALNHLFKGNITIEGKIVSSKGGEDPIEVFPYSKIGEDKRRVGITSRPPNEIASIFINLLIESLEAEQLTEISNIEAFEIDAVLNDLSSLAEEINNLNPNDSHFENINRDEDYPKDNLFIRLDFIMSNLSNLGLKERNVPSSIISALKGNNIKNGDLYKDLVGFVEILTQYFQKKSNSEASEFPKKLNFLSSQLKVIVDYINYFKSSGEKAEDAFLSFINLDHIGLDNIEANLKGYNKEINDFFKRQDTSAVFSSNKNQFLIRDSKSIKITDEIQSIYIDAIQEIKKLTQLRGTLIEKSLFPDGFFAYDGEETEKFLSGLIMKRPLLSINLAEKASEIIYLNLDYATINLKKERAQEGDYLYLYVVLEESARRGENKDSEIIQKILPIGSYELRNTNWKVKIADSFLLVNRIDQPDTNEDTDVSPSNFKGAPGVSLLLTRRNDGSDKNSVVNFLEPSIGINVSYVDFNKNDDVEIGAGLVLGLFNNKIFFTGGINLNGTGQDEDSPFYFGVGFSFANLASKLLKDK